jgi:hypothetical protein
MLSSWYRDVVLALGSLRKNAVLSLTAVLTLALGIGANTAIFTLLYGLVLRSLPTQDASHLVKIGIPSAAEPDSEENNAFMPYRMLQGLLRCSSQCGSYPRCSMVFRLTILRRSSAWLELW